MLEVLHGEDVALARDLVTASATTQSLLRKAAKIKSQIESANRENSARVPVLENWFEVIANRLDSVEGRYEELLRRIPGCAEQEP